ncbi:MAG TPA: phosphoribosylanthranilate isomerase [Bauldia sp.]|nr:phosphoribosylanthranilate isomerase [Bauldia sp.]
MKLTIKICGLSTEEAIDAAIDAGADMVGLNFFPPSPRYVTLERAGQLAARARGRAAVVAVTVDMTDTGLAEIVDVVKPDWIQAHGKESPARVAEMKKRFSRRVVKAIGIGEASDLGRTEAYRGIADGFLLDAKPPKGAILPGGNGEPFDWMILQDFRPGVPWLLSGGLNAGNVGFALRVAGAPGIDVSSGVEVAPGRKDPNLIRAFIAAARRVAPVEPEPAAG